MENEIDKQHKSETDNTLLVYKGVRWVGAKLVYSYGEVDETTTPARITDSFTMSKKINNLAVIGSMFWVTVANNNVSYNKFRIPVGKWEEQATVDFWFKEDYVAKKRADSMKEVKSIDDDRIKHYCKPLREMLNRSTQMEKNFLFAKIIKELSY